MDFDKAVEIILKHEGGYVNDAQDPGGETKYGISKRAYPDLDIAKLTVGHAKHIYEADYWTAMKCPGLPAQVRLMAFDAAVNQGPHAATRDLQSALGVKVDGILGPMTLDAAKDHKDPVGLLSAYAQARCDRYFKTNSFERFGRGWLRRLIDVTARSRA